MLKFTNTLTNHKQEFIPLEQQKIRLYVCGVTPYDDAHIGHGRCYVTFDLLYRLLIFLEYDVTYVRNFTDIDDKLLKKAEKEFNDQLRYSEIANRYIDRYHEDMSNLNCLTPTHEPRVTETISEIITFIQGLIENGIAYQVGGDVYYHVRAFKDYGKLSKRDIDDLKAGARVEINEYKKDPLDFALWKGEHYGTFFESPWGYGRPGWHIECSAMAHKFLGKHIDIHAGGMDLIFPHHENEVAQSEGLFGPKFANYWLHNAFVRIDKEKMSKSLGNFFTLREVFQKIDPMIMRFYFLSHHYRAPLDFSFDDLSVARTTYQRLARALDIKSRKKMSNTESINSHIVRDMLVMLMDDLNTPGMFGILHEHLATLKEDVSQRSAVVHFLGIVLGLSFELLPEQSIEITPEIQLLIDEREQARALQDYKKADILRAKLRELGFEVKDTKLT